MTIALHQDCVCCRARNGHQSDPPLDGEEATIVILAMVVAGTPLKQIMNDLCFAHGKRVVDTALVLL